MNPVLRILRLVISDVEECLVARDITGNQPRPAYSTTHSWKKGILEYTGFTYK